MSRNSQPTNAVWFSIDEPVAWLTFNGHRRLIARPHWRRDPLDSFLNKHIEGSPPASTGARACERATAGPPRGPDDPLGDDLRLRRAYIPSSHSAT